ncbi:MAG: TIM barrel protein [Candidatus Njordarchaeales archaeon]
MRISNLLWRIRFGPAGKPIGFTGDLTKVPEALREMGLNALEVQQVRQINITKEKASMLKEEAKKNDIVLSLHAPYAINFSSEKENVIEASKERLLRALEVAHWMDAEVVVLHPGYYGKRKPKEALDLVIEALKDVERAARKKRLRPLIGPETMGKKSQVGSLDEIIEIVKEVKKAIPVLDFAHIHAREGGTLNTRRDYEKIFEKIETELGAKALRRLHIHFTKVEFTDKGERCHRAFGEGMGPKFIPLAQILLELESSKVVIISESPVLEQDAIKMRDILIKLSRGASIKDLEKEE